MIGGASRKLLALVMLGVVVRLAVILPRLGAGMDDPDNYLPLARSLAAGRGFALADGRPTAYRPPLYPIVLAPIVASLGENRLCWGVGTLHLLLGAATIVLTRATARRWGMGDGAADAAAFLVACDPVLVVQARSVMTETMSAALTAATLAALAGPGVRAAMLGGLMFGLGALCRPSTLPAAALTAAAFLVLPGAGPVRDRLKKATAIVGVTSLTLLPWAWRNAHTVGEPVFTTTHGGYTLALANNPSYYADVLDGPAGAVWSGPDQQRWFDAITGQTWGLGEPESDRALRSSALRFIKGRPVDFARAALARLCRFWGVSPSGSVYPAWLRLATAAWTAPFWLALAAGFWRRDAWMWPRVPAAMFALALTVVHAFFWSDMRMRAPLIPALALLAAAGVTGRKMRPEKS